MQKVDMTKWGGSKVRANLKPLWQEMPADDTEFGTYQTSIATSITNTNELIDEVRDIKASLGELNRRPF